MFHLISDWNYLITIYICLMIYHHIDKSSSELLYSILCNIVCWEELMSLSICKSEVYYSSSLDSQVLNSINQILTKL